MPKYQDAAGYVLELKGEVSKNWFSAAVDLAIASNGSQFQEIELERIWTYLIGQDNYLSNVASIDPIVSVQQSGVAPVYFEKISSFTNFKKLSPNLNLDFNKKVTLIYGKNGSGKSSLCQALKLLSSPEEPANPLYNVRENSLTVTPSFTYQFKGWTEPSIWSEMVGYGSQAQFIKYFDSTVAISTINGEMKVENSVEVSVFRLELFDYVRSLVTAFQRYSDNKLAQCRANIVTEINAVFSQLESTVNIKVEPFTSWSPEMPSTFEEKLKNIALFGEKEERELIDFESKLQQHLAATSEQGLLALKAQLTMIQQVEQQLISLIGLCGKGAIANLQSIEINLQNKQSALMELSKEAFPNGINLQSHNDLIRVAANLTQFDKTDECPLCFQGLNANAHKLFSAYHQHLTSTLQVEIKNITQSLDAGLQAQDQMRIIALGDLSVLVNLFQVEFIDNLQNLVNLVKSSLPEKGQNQSQGDIAKFSQSSQIPLYVEYLKAQKAQLQNTLATAQQSSKTLAEETKKLQDLLGEKRAHKALCQRINDLLKICTNAIEYSKQYKIFKNQDFPSLLRKLTLKGKEAHTQLVLETFEEKLNLEYLSLSGMDLEQFGVSLASKGSDQDITVTPNIGKIPVHRVFSEGEQKVHALAVFMAEAVTHPYQLLVFDDPVTSFDYNYISNFCERLRDLIRNQAETQIIVLTHNWDFFVNLQTTLNRSGLNNSLSVQVLEDCSTVEEYSEKWDELCTQIETIVNDSVEPNSEQKERVSGLMRRLIERLTNSYVFNEQRHQYKIKTLQDSNFHNFTKIVPLTVDEANELRDLYANLSPPEHDDVRNYYTSKTRLQFKNWHDRILNVKNAVESRKPC